MYSLATLSDEYALSCTFHYTSKSTQQNIPNLGKVVEISHMAISLSSVQLQQHVWASWVLKTYWKYCFIMNSGAIHKCLDLIESKYIYMYVYFSVMPSIHISISHVLCFRIHDYCMQWAFWSIWTEKLSRHPCTSIIWVRYTWFSCIHKELKKFHVNNLNICYFWRCCLYLKAIKQFIRLNICKFVINKLKFVAALFTLF